MTVSVLALVVSVAWATGTLGQRNPGPTDGFAAICAGQLARTFAAGLNGVLDTVDVQVARQANSGDPIGDMVVAIVDTETLANPGYPDEENVSRIPDDRIARSPGGS